MHIDLQMTIAVWWTEFKGLIFKAHWC